jgi:hypothetical protein
MAKLSNHICMFLVVVAPLALGGEPRSSREPKLSGHYYLEDGPSEVGSELLLRDSGQFEWALMYGAADYAAKVTWQLTGKRMVLSSTPKSEPMFRMFGDDDYHRTKPAQRDRWIAVVGVPFMGPVADIEVRFEARSGKAGTAVSKPNGDAIVEMPSNEVWTRAGLRRAGSEVPWQWFSVAPQRAQARLVGFALTNLDAVRSASFASLTLRVAPKGLVIDDDASGLHGTYAKH